MPPSAQSLTQHAESPMFTRASSGCCLRRESIELPTSYVACTRNLPVPEPTLAEPASISLCHSDRCVAAPELPHGARPSREPAPLFESKAPAPAHQHI